jgi:hypothetical protein
MVWRKLKIKRVRNKRRVNQKRDTAEDGVRKEILGVEIAM